MADRIVLDGELSLDLQLDGTVGLLTLIEAGIAQIVFNDDYTITFILTDGREFTTGSIRGAAGEKGDKGDQGIQGIPGIQGEKGDKGDTGASGRDGAAGADGISPTVSITSITGGHRITITDADGQHSADVMDGDDYVLTQQDKSDIAGLVNVPVDDVQINSTSIVQNGVANIPIATNDNLGVVRTNSTYGVYATNGTLAINNASESDIKSGTNSAKPLTPHREHMSTFYGLAKAAGDTTQSQSNNSVGTYTDEAKIAIQKMLGLYQSPWELIADYTVPEDSETVEVITDLSGQPFELTDSLIMVYFQPSLTGTNDYIKGNHYVRNANNEIGFVGGFPTVKYMANGAATYSEYKQEIIIDVLRTEVRTGTSINNTQDVQSISTEGAITSIMGFRLLQYNATSTLIPHGTRILIYGRRKV